MVRLSFRKFSAALVATLIIAGLGCSSESEPAVSEPRAEASGGTPQPAANAGTQDLVASEGGEAAVNVTVASDKSSYRRGEPIVITISNDLQTAIHAPASEPYCSLVNVQRLEAGEWVTEDSCAVRGLASSIEIAPNSNITGVAGPTAQEAGTQGPIVSEPSTPSVSQVDVSKLPTVEPYKEGDPIRELPRGGSPPEALGPTPQDSGTQGPMVIAPSVPSLSNVDVSTLPTVEPYKPGDPIRELPRGGMTSELSGLPFSALEGDIEPGTYRVAFSFIVGAPSGPAQTIYSAAFDVE